MPGHEYVATLATFAIRWARGVSEAVYQDGQHCHVVTLAKTLCSDRYRPVAPRWPTLPPFDARVNATTLANLDSAPYALPVAAMEATR